MARRRARPDRVPNEELALQEWVEFGIRELDVYLGKHASFAAYYTKKQLSDRAKRGWQTRRANQPKEDA